jgi:hypothetical protein
MRRLLRVLLLGLVSAAFAQDPMGIMLHSERLAEPLGVETVHFSSYATNGGNDDLGHYQGVDAAGWKILCDIAGPGMITDWWWTKPGATSAWRIRIFVDDTVHAVVDTPITYLFGDMDPFRPPVADSSTSSYYNYAPIPFQSRARITFNNISTIYYHITAHKYPPGTVIESFTMPPSADYLAKLDSLSDMLSSPSDPIFSPAATESDELTTTLADGQTISLNSTETSGRTRRLLLRFQNRTQQVFENFQMRIYTDGYPVPDIEGPVSVAMGTPLGWRTYQSCVTGMLGDTLYFNLPIWFDGGMRVEFENMTGAAQDFTAILETIDESPKSWRLLGQFHEANPNRFWEDNSIANFAGPGNYVGTMLDVQQRDNHVLEGDESFYIDGETTPSWHGTGTEDYFKGGYYWTPAYDRLGFHGCVAYLGDSAAAYRWHLGDAIAFEESLRFGIEVGRFNNLSGHYRSMGFAYCARPKWRVLDASGDGKSHSGEKIRVVGNGLDPNDGVDGVAMNGTWLVPDVGASLTISADSIFDATFLASDTLLEGSYSLIVIRAQEDTVDATWEHLAHTTLWFRPQRTDIDTTVHAGDTLEIEIHGLQEAEGVTVTAGGLACDWVGLTPYADSHGKIVGKVRVPDGLLEGSLPLQGVPDISVPVTADTPLKYRNWWRVEPEVLLYSTWSGTRIRDEWCRDWISSGNTDPWGRMAAYGLYGTNTTHYVTLPFYAPHGGTYHAGYFMARTSAGAIVTIEINGETSLSSYDSYYPTMYNSWIRSDTLWGGTHVLNEGYNTLKMKLVGLNPSSPGWKAIFDQVIFVAQPTDPALFAADSVVIWSDSLNMHLAWPPITEDINGDPGSPAFMDIYRASLSDTLYYLRATIAGTDTTWAEAYPAGEGTYFYQVLGRGSGVAAMREAPREIENSKSKIEKKRIEKTPIPRPLSP